LWVSPTIVAVGVSTIWSAVMNAGEKFAFAAIVPLFTPGITIGFLLLFPQLQTGTLVAGLFVGSAIELTCLAIALNRQRVNPLPRWYGWTPELRHVLTQFMPTIIGQLIMSGTAIVDRAMASSLGEGSVAALNYGERLISLPINLLVTALGTAVIPYFSRSVAAGNWQEVRQTVIKYSTIVFAISVPICACFYFLSEPMTQILFERGSFTRADTILVAKIQAMYVLQIPFYLAAILTVRVVTALDLNLMMGLGCIINFAVNIVLNYVFMKWMGLPGIALSTGFVYLISWLYLLGCAYIKLNDEIFIARWLDRHRYQAPSDGFVEGEKNTFIKSALF
jgi:putative peptidoglycan lipid II flippase